MTFCGASKHPLMSEGWAQVRFCRRKRVCILALFKSVGLRRMDISNVAQAPRIIVSTPHELSNDKL